jgi:FSR family fosmidomycin resistance protein-like MFS transporter
MSAVASAPATTGREAAPSRPPRFDTAAVLTISFGHFVHDTFPAFLSTLLPLLIQKHGLSLAAAGALAGVLRWSAVIHPFMGYWADRTNPRYWVIFAPTVTALGMSLIGLAPSYLAVVLLLVLTGLSHAAFHPAGGAQVTLVSGRSWGRGTSIFIAGGELGRALGPLYIVAIVQAFGLEASWIAVTPAILASLLLHWRLAGGQRLALRPPPAGLREAIRRAGRGLAVLAIVILFRNLATSSFTTFIPTYLTDGGTPLWLAGLALSVYELAGVVGALTGGSLSDRFGRRNVLAVGQVLSAPALLLALGQSDTTLQLAMIAVAGLFSLSSGPAQMALVQELLPDNRSLATGLLMFLGMEGAVMTTIGVGVAADHFGLGVALQTSVALSMLCVPFVFALPETRGLGASGH